MIEPIRINRPARQKMWVDTYRHQRRRQKRLGWALGLLVLAAIALAAILLDGCAGAAVAARWMR